MGSLWKKPQPVTLPSTPCKLNRPLYLVRWKDRTFQGKWLFLSVLHLHTVCFSCNFSLHQRNLCVPFVPPSRVVIVSEAVKAAVKGAFHDFLTSSCTCRINVPGPDDAVQHAPTEKPIVQPQVFMVYGSTQAGCNMQWPGKAWLSTLGLTQPAPLSQKITAESS